MELNRKLTHLLKGRTIQSESGDEDHVVITFDDQSTLKLIVATRRRVSYKRCCDNPLPFRNERQQAFATSSS